MYIRVENSLPGHRDNPRSTAAKLKALMIPVLPLVINAALLAVDLAVVDGVAGDLSARLVVVEALTVVIPEAAEVAAVEAEVEGAAAALVTPLTCA